MITKDTRELNVTVTRVILPREEFTDGKERWTIMNTNEGKCVGMLAFYPKAGTRLRLTGNAEVFHGELNFRFRKVAHNAPVDKHALLIYAASLSKGVGDKAVEKIWATYGGEWDRHLEEMAPTWCNALTRTLNELNSNEERLRVIAFMIHIGGTPKMAEAAYLRWKDGAISTIENDPYVLATLPGIGFKTVDGKIRESFKIGDTDMRRAIAAIDYAVTNLLEESGNSVLTRDMLYSTINELHLPHSIASKALSRLVHSGRIVYVGLDKITTSSVVKHEGDFARYCASHCKFAETRPSVCWDGDFRPDKSQIVAVDSSLANYGLTIINGGAGCGKTTIIRSIVKSLEQFGSQVRLCAFAGKAAARLREASGRSASTIHSMLGWAGDGLGFTSGNLHGVTVILDEASMVPSSLLYELTRRDPERLILVGDQAQLQPVGIGSPFHDAIDELPSLVNTLTTCYRNKEAVFSAAFQIRSGEIPRSAKSSEEVFDVRRMKNPEEVHDYIVEKVKAGDIDFAQDLVLSPRNGDGEDAAKATVKALNESIQAIVNPHRDGEKFKAGDRVMCTKNCREKDLWNGTTGWISRVDIDGKPWFKVDGGEEVRITDAELLKSIVPAYCLTVHKAQGSQYRNVYVCCLRRDEARLFDRSMLYTAVTRARHGCFLLCDDGTDKIVNAVRRRVTYLQLVLKGEV